MTPLSRGVKVHLAFGFIDMRKGIDGLAMLVQGVLRQDPFSGHLFVFRGRKAHLIKIVYWDGSGLWSCAKRLERGRFSWPVAEDQSDRVSLSHEELSLLLGGIDLTRARRKNWYRKTVLESEKV